MKPKPKPGWQVETTRGAYAKSYPVAHGAPVSEGVKEIVWSGKLLDENYDDFGFLMQLAAELKPGPLYFPVTQTCEKGEIAWNEIPADGQNAHALKAPAPALMIVAQAAAGCRQDFQGRHYLGRSAVVARDTRRRAGRRRLYEDHE